MDKDSNDAERDGLMALAKQKVSTAIKEVTSKHAKLPKKLAEMA